MRGPGPGHLVGINPLPPPTLLAHGCSTIRSVKDKPFYGKESRSVKDKPFYCSGVKASTKNGIQGYQP